MRYIYLVALREFAENARTKGFWIGILVFPLVFLVAFEAQRILGEATPTRHFMLVDQSGEFRDVVQKGLDRLHQRDIMRAIQSYARKNARPDTEKQEVDLESIPASFSIEKVIEQYAPEVESFMSSGGKEAMLAMLRPGLKDDAPAFEEPRRRFQQVPLPEGVDPAADISELSDQLKPYLLGQKTLQVDDQDRELFAAILIPKNILDEVTRPGQISIPGEKRKGIQYWGINLADDDLKDEIEDVINDEIRAREYVAHQIDAATVQSVQRTMVPFSQLNPKKEIGKEEVSMADVIRQWAPVAFVYLLWVAIFTISNMLLNNTIEEKSNRIIEVLLSSVTPRELMLGKLFGIAAVGLTMLTAWIGAAIVILQLKSGPESETASQLLRVLTDSGLLPAFAVYFILGYFMYAGAFLAVGSVCNTIKEAQNLMGVVTILMIVPLLTMSFIPKDPNGTLATVMSWIPIYTPFVMMNRAAADPPLFDVVGTFILLAGFTFLSLWSTGKIFRIGILRTGQPPKILEMLRWLKPSR